MKPWISCFVLIALFFSIFTPLSDSFGLWLRNYPILSLPLLAVFLCPSAFVSVTISGVYLVFLLSLVGPWATGTSDPSLLGGLLPYMDANTYYSDARLLAEGFRISLGGSKRPLFAATLASLFQINGGNLKIGFLIYTSLFAVSSIFFLLECRRQFGSIASIVTGLLLVTFYNRFNGVVLTEQLGLSCGVLSAYFLLAGSRSPINLFWGGFVLCLGLNARAGAFFVLPSLLYWKYCDREDSQRIRNLVLLFMAFILGFGINSLVTRLVTPPGSIPFGNGVWTLYGLVSGGKGWGQILVAHPELAKLRDPDLTRLALQACWNDFLAHPHLLLVGIVRSVIEFFLPTGAGTFGFFFWERFYVVRLGDVQRYFNVGARLIFLVGLFRGLYLCYARKNDPVLSLLLFFFLGILISIPMIPPIDCDQVRVYAVHMPLFFLMTGMGFKVGWQKTEGEWPILFRGSLTMSGCFLFLMLLSPLKRVLFPATVNPPMLFCKEGQRHLSSFLWPGSSVQVSGGKVHWMRQINQGPLLVSQKEFRAGLANFAGTEPRKIRTLVGMGVGDELFLSPDMQGEGEYWFILKDPSLPSSSRFEACVGKVLDPGIAIVQVHEMKMISD